MKQVILTDFDSGIAIPLDAAAIKGYEWRQPHSYTVVHTDDGGRHRVRETYRAIGKLLSDANVDTNVQLHWPDKCVGLTGGVTKKPTGHPHAALMAMYAEDAATHARPWELWQEKTNLLLPWVPCSYHPNWVAETEYRRAPAEVLMNARLPIPEADPEVSGTVVTITLKTEEQASQFAASLAAGIKNGAVK